MKLIKGSYPGWAKEFVSEEECRIELYDHICGYCRIGNEDEDPVDENSSLNDLLCTPCGLEFFVEE